MPTYLGGATCKSKRCTKKVEFFIRNKWLWVLTWAVLMKCTAGPNSYSKETDDIM